VFYFKFFFPRSGEKVQFLSDSDTHLGTVLNTGTHAVLDLFDNKYRYFPMCYRTVLAVCSC